MPDVLPPRMAVRVTGIYRGHELDGPADLELRDDQLAIHPTDEVLVDRAPRSSGLREVVLSFDHLDGLRMDGTQLTLFIRGGDVLELEGSFRVTELADEIGRRICMLPEQTLTLRALGSRRGSGRRARGSDANLRAASDRDRFFAPLLESRRRSETADSFEDRVLAFEAARLRAAMLAVLRELAAERYPVAGPDRRALEEELNDGAEEFMETFDLMQAAAGAARGASDEARFVRFREWAATVQLVFEQADRCWMNALPVLERPAAHSRRSMWRRLFGRFGHRA